MSPLYAYIGPGAGFAFLGSFLSLIASFFLTAAALLLWPFRAARAAIRRKQTQRHAKIKKIIFLGLDGLDPRLTERYMAAGKLPNFARLKAKGSFHKLRTTFPALSPVAWSTFATGVSPAKHNIFDFLNRSLKTYAPELAPSKVKPAQRILRLGRLRLPLSKPIIEMRRKSESFWKILGDHSIPSTILRVPITFPPEDFNGRLLSAMCTPDLRGTQGTYTQFTAPANTQLEAALEGPTNELLEGANATKIPFRLTPQSNNTATLEIAGASHNLKRGEYTPWLRLPFNAVPGINIHGIARFLLTETEPELKLYVTPIQIDPESPALPISHPAYYATYLAKLQGAFATVGMAEDTWALNDSAIDETDFLTQAYSIMDEREAMFANALAHTKQGVVACVFDTSDRVQHMFFRHLDGHGDPRYAHVIENLYERMDGLLGKALEHLDDDTILFALSDHGFCAFRRAVNLNSWLHQNGYLQLTENKTIDWPNTKAYCLGLSGLYLNLKGREAQGTVTDAEALKAELIAKLTGLPDNDEIAITHVYATNRLYKGPYLTAAPDLIIGYNEGYRTSWDAAIGKVTTEIIEDNPKAWSGDHCVDPLLVPGVLFSSRKIDAEDPGIEDMAPTALNLFGLPTPPWMDGKSVFST
jgi:predicted AlkP superfamily phosphohydrolase/phosphomutase